MVGIGHAELGQRGTVIDPIVGAQAAQIPPPRVDLDWIDGRTPPRGRASRVLLDLGKHRALGDRRTGLDGQPGDDAVLVRRDRVLHFHGLQHHHQITG